jgi:hypothetical protein
MNELESPKLSRPLDKANLSNDNATLRNLIGVLNNPAITGAEVPESEKANFRPFPSAQTPTSPEQQTQTQTPASASPTAAAPAVSVSPVAAPVPPPTAPSNRLFFTGRGVSEVVKAIGAYEFAINAPIIALARHFFPGLGASTAGAETFLSTLKAFGNGEFSTIHPATPGRATFIVMVRTLGKQGLLPGGDLIDWTKFGLDEGFWIDTALRQAEQYSDRAVITGISSEMEHQYFTAKGFQHWHITARPGHKAGSGGAAADKLNTAIDNNLTKQISQQREGRKLRAVWNDTANPISNRLWSVADFVTACGGSNVAAPAAETTISFE